MLRDRGTCPSITKTHSSAATRLGFHEARCKRATAGRVQEVDSPLGAHEEALTASSETTTVFRTPWTGVLQCVWAVISLGR